MFISVKHCDIIGRLTHEIVVGGETKVMASKAYLLRKVLSKMGLFFENLDN